MNLLLLEATDQVPGDPAGFTLGGTRARHVREVLSAGVGATLRVGLIDGPVGTATVTRIEPGRVDLACVFRETPKRSGLSLLLAVPRPIALQRILRDVAAFGVDHVVLCRSWRVQRSYLQSKVLDVETYRPLLREGMMQGAVTWEPEVRLEPKFTAYVKDRAASEFKSARRLLAHPEGPKDIADLDLAPDRKVVVAIGPEGGWIPSEVEELERAGFETVRAGPRILRVETAVVALLAQVELLRRRRRAEHAP